MSDDDERAFWRLHVGHADWPSFERWAAVAARSGFPWGLDFVRASRRYPRAVRRAEYRSVARHGVDRVSRATERARGIVHVLRTRGRRALRELRRADRVPRNHGPIPAGISRGIHSLLTDLIDESGARVRDRRRRERTLDLRDRTYLARIRPDARSSHVMLDDVTYEKARGWYAPPVGHLERMRVIPDVFEVVLQSEEIARERVARVNPMRICSTCGTPESAHPREECPRGFNDVERIRERTGVRFTELEDGSLVPAGPAPSPVFQLAAGDDSHAILADLLRRAESVEGDFAGGWRRGRRIVAIADTRVGRVRFAIGRFEETFYLEARLVSPPADHIPTANTSIGTTLPGRQRLEVAAMSAIEQIEASLARAGERPRNYLRVPAGLQQALLRLRTALVVRPDDFVPGVVETLLLLIGIGRDFAERIAREEPTPLTFQRRIMRELCQFEACDHSRVSCPRNGAVRRVREAHEAEARGEPLPLEAPDPPRPRRRSRRAT